jgi:hypothetical protein
MTNHDNMITAEDEELLQALRDWLNSQHVNVKDSVPALMRMTAKAWAESGAFDDRAEFERVMKALGLAFATSVIELPEFVEVDVHNEAVMHDLSKADFSTIMSNEDDGELADVMTAMKDWLRSRHVTVSDASTAMMRHAALLIVMTYWTDRPAMKKVGKQLGKAFTAHAIRRYEKHHGH